MNKLWTARSRKHLIAGLAVAGSAALAACGSGPTARPAAAAPHTATAPHAAAPSTGRTGRQTVVLYASVPQKSLNAEVAAFEKADPNVHMVVYRNGTGPVTAKVDAERRAGRIRADVVWLAAPPAIMSWAKQGLLLDWNPPQASALTKAGRGPSYWPTRVINVILAYHKGMSAPVPKNWNDLTNPVYKGRVGVPDPAYAGSTLAALGYFAANPKYGMGFYRHLVQNGTVQLQGNQQVADGIAQGRFEVGMTLDYMVDPMEKRGSPIVPVWPKGGAIAVPSPIAIFKSSPHVAGAKAFVSFVLSKAGQEVLVSQSFEPARLDLRKAGEGLQQQPNWQRLTQDKSQLLSEYKRVFPQ